MGSICCDVILEFLGFKDSVRMYYNLYICLNDRVNVVFEY